MSLMKPLVKPLNIANFAIIQLTKSSGVVHTPTNLAASAKASDPNPPTQVNVSKATKTSRSFYTRTFCKNDTRISPIPKWSDLSALKRLTQTALILPLAATTFSTQAMSTPRQLHWIFSSLSWTASYPEKTPSMPPLTFIINPFVWRYPRQQAPLRTTIQAHILPVHHHPWYLGPQMAPYPIQPHCWWLWCWICRWPPCPPPSIFPQRTLWNHWKLEVWFIWRIQSQVVLHQENLSPNHGRLYCQPTPQLESPWPQ